MGETLNFGGDNFEKNGKKGKNEIREERRKKIKSKWIPEVLNGGIDDSSKRQGDGVAAEKKADNLVLINDSKPEEMTEEHIITKEMQKRSRKESFSSNYYPIREQEEPAPLAKRINGREIADQLVDSALPGASERDDANILKEIQNSNNELMSQINRESLAISKKINERFMALVDETIGGGSKDIGTAKKINSDLQDIRERLEVEIKLLEEFNKSTDEIVEQINKNIFAVGDELGKKYTSSLIEALKGGRSTDVEAAREMNEKVKSLNEQLQAEIKPE